MGMESSSCLGSDGDRRRVCSTSRIIINSCQSCHGNNEYISLWSWRKISHSSGDDCHLIRYRDCGAPRQDDPCTIRCRPRCFAPNGSGGTYYSHNSESMPGDNSLGSRYLYYPDAMILFKNYSPQADTTPCAQRQALDRFIFCTRHLYSKEHSSI